MLRHSSPSLARSPSFGSYPRQQRHVSTKCGIVGLPNVGKSTLFNALTASQRARAGNYPFCTIDPNVGSVPIYDERLQKLAEAEKSKRTIQAEMEFIDIAGLISGASKGEGLGNRFLSHIRSVDVVAFVLRCFIDDSIQHVNDKVNPLADMDTLNTELMLADMEAIDKRKKAFKKKVPKDKQVLYQQVIDKAEEALGKELPLRALEWNRDENTVLKDMQLLTPKKALYICNVDESGEDKTLVHNVKETVSKSGDSSEVIEVCASLESEIAMIENLDERQEMLQEYGLTMTGLDRVVHAAYKLLDVLTFYTGGESESRAWIIPRGSAAPQAAAAIHSDFEKHFIRAETISFDEFEKHGTMAACKKKGAMRLEGRDYLCKDGDVYVFRTSA